MSRVSDDDLKDHALAVLQSGQSATRYVADVPGLSAGRLLRYLRQNGLKDRYDQEAALQAASTMQDVLARQGDLAKGFADVIESIQQAVLGALAAVTGDTSDDAAERATARYAAQDVERLVKAAGVASDKLVAILGTDAALVAGRLEGGESAHLVTLQRLVEKHAQRAGALSEKHAQSAGVLSVQSVVTARPAEAEAEDPFDQIVAGLDAEEPPA